jgi:hypothetical protein
MRFLSMSNETKTLPKKPAVPPTVPAAPSAAAGLTVAGRSPAAHEDEHVDALRIAIGERTPTSKLFLVALPMHKSRVRHPGKGDPDNDYPLMVATLPVWAEHPHHARELFEKWNGIIQTQQLYTITDAAV